MLGVGAGHVDIDQAFAIVGQGILDLAGNAFANVGVNDLAGTDIGIEQILGVLAEVDDVHTNHVAIGNRGVGQAKASGKGDWEETEFHGIT
jgi:hypothetical protein